MEKKKKKKENPARSSWVVVHSLCIICCVIISNAMYTRLGRINVVPTTLGIEFKPNTVPGFSPFEMQQLFYGASFMDECMSLVPKEKRRLLHASSSEMWEKTNNHLCSSPPFMAIVYRPITERAIRKMIHLSMNAVTWKVLINPCGPHRWHGLS